MLTQIKKIKNLGVFDNYAAAADLPAFSRYNIVYGENGSGKTTLSRLLDSLEAGEHADHPALEYTVESQSGAFTHGTKYARRIRVFNADYVEANIGRFDGPMRHILIVGAENKALADELKAEMFTRDERSLRLESIKTTLAKADTDKGKLFSQIAKTISEAISGLTLRSYRKPDAEDAYGKLADAKSLSEDELAVHRATVLQDQMAPLVALKASPLVRPDGEADVIDIAASSASRAKELVARSAQAAVIERLAKNPEIAVWVEQGVHFHTDNSQGNCEFCAQPLPANRLTALANHFSIEDQHLKDELDGERALLADVMVALNAFELPDPLAFYSELRPTFEAAAETLTTCIAALDVQLHDVDQALAEKLTLRMTAYERELFSDAGPLMAALDAVNAIIQRHNDKTANFDTTKSTARNAIEAHYLLGIKEQVVEFDKQTSALKAEIELLVAGGEGLPDPRGLEALSASIFAKQAQVSNAHAGGTDLTEHLKRFLGRTDLRFESDNDGYRVLRRGKPAKRLSEGEKTAIAFLYFLVQLKDQNFDLAEGVVVIDDPISSLDAAAIYQAFSFLKNETQAAKQLFILTHNFEFLRLLINWLRNIPGPKSDKSYTMVLCSETAAGRSARLVPLDKLLVEHATEYHYLFKVLYTFQSDGTILGCYHVPNIARKVLETFLDFHVPSSKSLYQKMEQVDFDPHKKTAIYKFANDLSHFTGKGFDPALVAEAQKNTAHLLDMIKEVAPLHYAGVEQLSKT